MLDRDSLIVVVGAGGFIGGHMVKRLVHDDWRKVRAVDRKPLGAWFQRSDAAENVLADVAYLDEAHHAIVGARYVINLAADMGGIGFIEGNRARCMLSVLPSTQLLLAAHACGVERFFFASSACVYPQALQGFDGGALREADAYPADPEDGYGWEKLFTERLCRHFAEDFGLETRVARLHNIYGPHGTYAGGREKAPAAICRKVIQAKLDGASAVEIWGDGEQRRSFTYIDDCVAGTLRILDSEVDEPLNLGSDHVVSINELVDAVEAIAGVRLGRLYLPGAPQGVRARNSDNTLIKERLGWEPRTSLAEGLVPTYRWIYDQMVGRS